MSPRDMDAEFVQAIRDCTNALRTITELITVSTRELDEATRQMASLQWKIEPLQVTLADAAKMLSLSKHSVRALVTKGELEATGKRTSLRVTVESIHAYIAREARANQLVTSSIFEDPFGAKAHARRSRMRYASFKEIAPRNTNALDSIFRRDGPFKCPECGRGFDSERGLQAHKRRPGIMHKLPS